MLEKISLRLLVLISVFVGVLVHAGCGFLLIVSLLFLFASLIQYLGKLQNVLEGAVRMRRIECTILTKYRGWQERRRIRDMRYKERSLKLMPATNGN